MNISSISFSFFISQFFFCHFPSVFFPSLSLFFLCPITYVCELDSINSFLFSFVLFLFLSSTAIAWMRRAQKAFVNDKVRCSRVVTRNPQLQMCTAPPCLEITTCLESADHQVALCTRMSRRGLRAALWTLVSSPRGVRVVRRRL